MEPLTILRNPVWETLAWYMPSVLQEVKGLGVPFYADHMRSLTEIFDSKYRACGTSWFGSSAYHCADRVLTRISQSVPRERQGSTDLSRLPIQRWPYWHNKLCPAGTLQISRLRFVSALFFSVARRMPVYITQRRGKIHTPIRHRSFTQVSDHRRQSNLRPDHRHFVESEVWMCKTSWR